MHYYFNKPENLMHILFDYKTVFETFILKTYKFQTGFLFDLNS